jgi:hypothetical protein
METTIDAKIVRTYQLSVEDRKTLKIPIIETHSVKYVLKSDSPDGDQAIKELIKGEPVNIEVTCMDSKPISGEKHPVRFTRKQITFIEHMINEVGLERWEEECLDLLKSIGE